MAKIEAHCGTWFHFMVLPRFVWLYLWRFGIVAQSWMAASEGERMLGVMIGPLHLYVYRQSVRAAIARTTAQPHSE